MAYNDRNFYQDRNGNYIDPTKGFTDAQGNQYAPGFLDRLTEYQRLKAGIVHAPPHRLEFNRTFRHTPDEFKNVSGLKENFISFEKTNRDRQLNLTHSHLEALAASGVSIPSGISNFRAAVELAHDIRVAQISGVTSTKELEALFTSGLYQYPHSIEPYEA